MTAIIKRPGQPAFRRTIDNDLKTLQELVGGPIKAIPLDHDIVAIANRSSISGSYNFRADTETVVLGTAVMLGAEENVLCSLNAMQESYLLRRLA